MKSEEDINERSVLPLHGKERADRMELSTENRALSGFLLELCRTFPVLLPNTGNGVAIMVNHGRPFLNETLMVNE